MADDTSASDQDMPPAEDMPQGEMSGTPPEMMPGDRPGEMPGDMPGEMPGEMPPPAMPPEEIPPPPMEPPPAESYPPPPPPPAQYAPPPPPAYMPPMETLQGRPGPASDTSKILAALGYVFPIIALVMLFVDPYKDEKFVKFHAVQAIAIWIAEAVANVLWVIPIIGWIAAPVASLVLFVVAIIALIKAFQGEYYEIPVVYPAVKSFFNE